MSVIINPAAASAGMSIGGAVVGGTPGSVLFIGAGSVLAQDNAKFFWDDTAFSLDLKAGSVLSLGGSSSGAVTIATKAAAGTWTMTLPTSAGTNLYVLQTDGTGITSWVPQSGSGGVSIGGTVSGGTSPAILFVNPSGILAQDPTNLGWDSVNKAFLIESSPAVFRVPNASGNNWFEDNAGNFTLTGFLNFGTGDGCLSSLTTGTRNTGYGNAALFTCTTGFDNFGIGFQALSAITSGDSNVGVGTFVMQLGATLSNNVGLGFSTLRQLGSAGASPIGNVGVGAQALNQLRSGNSNVAVGYTTAQNIHDGTNNVILGNSSLNQATGTNTGNVFVGGGAGFNVTNASNCTVLGSWFGPSGPLSSIIAFTDGSNPIVPHLDWSYTTSNIWSFHQSTNPQGLHVYNTFDQVIPTVNYERVCLDWNITSNVARIASQAGGTGTVRIIAIDGFQKAGAPVAADLPSGTWGLINDTSGGNTWLCYNNSGTIRKVQLV